MWSSCCLGMSPLPGRAGNIPWVPDLPLTLASLLTPHLEAPSVHSALQMGIALQLQLRALVVCRQGLELEPL